MSYQRGARALLVPLAIVCAAAPARAQEQAGQVVGRVVDAATGRGLPGARISVEGSSAAAVSGVDGRYTLLRVPAGTRSVAVTLLGHAAKTVTGVQVGAGRATSLDVALTQAAVQLAAISVSATRERGTVSRALDEQRSATGIVNATTSEQIARSPDADAARAVQRVSGVTVQDGRYVFVRGLGERYTTASLNGARLPSPEPEKRVVPLDLFPSALLESITTSKTFTPDQPGDFSGAQVNLKTRSFPAHHTVSYSVSSGLNASAAGKSLPFAPTVGGRDWVALGASSRALPGALAGVDFGSSALTQPQVNGLIRSFRNTWTPVRQTPQPNGSAALSVGGEDPFLGHRVGYIGSLTYARTQDVRLDEVNARSGAGAGGVPVARDVFRGQTGETSVLWGGLLNLSTMLGTGSRLELNNTYDRSADNTGHEDTGLFTDADIRDVHRTQLRYVERRIRSNQLRATHTLAGTTVDWSVTSSAVTRREPDRADLVYGRESVAGGGYGPLAWLGVPDGSKRTFGDLRERTWSEDASWRLGFGGARDGLLKVGGALRTTARDAASQSYEILPGARAGALTPDQRAEQPETFFVQHTQAGDSALTLSPNTSGGTYDAHDRVAAGFAMVEVSPVQAVRVIGGARLESWRLRLGTATTAGGRYDVARDNTDVLPSLAVNVALSDRQNVRLSATQTLSRPEYRELSPVSYRDLLGSQDVFGDTSLVRTRVQNYDARWEWYPAAGEILSASLFAKRFADPIEQIEVATSGAQQISYTNAKSATSYGVELEARKGLEFLGERLSPLSVFANATFIRSQVRLREGGNSALTNGNRAMVGQAPYVVNAGVSYAGDGGTSATLLYNVVGRRITRAATLPIADDVYQLPRSVLDLSLRFPLWSTLAAKVDGSNLLDSRFQEKQGDVVRRSYRTGRTVAFGLSWRAAGGR
ncbi:MAG: TonB-dependent receptor [Gemmatimonadetes bacterium]|nr:TonB-dependent receptor [Gemmatimonadota bacterium]